DCVAGNENRAIPPWFSHSLATIMSRKSHYLKYIEIFREQNRANLAFPYQQPSIGSFGDFVKNPKD
ncbi:hypothetical protein, partial [Cypionkella sp.]|uniref:hypothetical protein n=1 Tax=Cypionkella sp. TaxID=2811411 RepID=UPI002ABC9DFA